MVDQQGKSTAGRISINRAPVLTLWAAVVAERLGYQWEEALTLGRAVAGLNAQAKGRRLGILKPAPTPAAGKRRPPPKAGEALQIELLGRTLPAVRTPEGIRALGAGGSPESPQAVLRYLSGKFDQSFPVARRAMSELAASLEPRALEAQAYALYEGFRPTVPAGKGGWGAKGVLDLDRLRMLARRRQR